MAAKTKVGIENGKLIIENFMITSLTGSYERPLLVGASGNLSSSYTSSLSVENGGTGLDYIGEANQLLGVYVTGGIAQYKTLHGENLTVNFYADVSGTIGLTASLDMPLISSSFSSGNFGYINENGYIVDSGWTARDFNASGNFEASHSQGTDVQFYRGDKTWQNTSSMGFIPRISGSFVSGNFGYINENGYLVDSGWNAADFEAEGNFELSHSQGTTAQYYRGDKTWQAVSQFEVSRSLGTDVQYLKGNNTWANTSSMGFMPIVSASAPSGNFAFFNDNKYLGDSGKNASSFEISHSQGKDTQYYTGLKGWAETSSMGFIDIPVTATENNLAVFDNTRHLKDGGISSASLMLKDGSVAFTSPVAGITPTLPAHLTTKAFVEQLFAALDWQTDVKSIYDNTGGLPVSPVAHDRYIASASANGWTKDWIYEYQYTGSSWDATPITGPSTGSMVLVADENTYYRWAVNKWTEFNGLDVLIAGAGLDKSGNTLSVKVDGTSLGFDGGGDTLKVVDGVFELSQSNGTIAQYWRGDKTWQTLNLATIGAEASRSLSDDTKYLTGQNIWANTSSMNFIPRISGSFASGNFGYINENGYLVDSGWNAADFEPEGNYELSQSNGTVGEFWRGDKTWAAIDLTTRELSHSQGTISQYYRGDKTWQEVSQFEVSRSLGTDTQFLGGNNTWRETSSMQFIPYVTGGYASGNFSFFNANGYLADSNKNIGSFEVSYSQGSDVQYYTGLKGWANTSSMGFIPLVSASATSGNFCFFNGNKFPADSGKSAASFELSMSNGTTGEYLRGDKTWAAIDLTTRELSHSQGTTAQYYRGDKTWQAVSQFEVSRSLGTVGQYLKGNNTWANTSSLPFIPYVSGGFASGNFAFFNSNGYLADSNKNITSFAAAIHNHGTTYELSQSNGTVAQFWRGDKTWQAVSVESGMPVTSASFTSGNFGGLNENGFVDDSGFAPDDFELSMSNGTTGEYLRGDKTWAAIDLSAYELSQSNGAVGEFWRGDKTWAAIDLTTRELSHSQGTIAQYYRGDKTWQAVSQFEVSRSLGTDVQYLAGNNTWQATSSMQFIPVVSASATSGNFAFFNSNKFPADSGKNASSFELSHSQGTTAQYYRGDKTWQAVSQFEVSRSLGTDVQYLKGNNTWQNTSSMGFIPKLSGSFTSGNFGYINENGYIVDSGWNAADFEAEGNFELSHSQGTTAQYYRGDKTWQAVSQFEVSRSLGTTGQYLAGNNTWANTSSLPFMPIGSGSVTSGNLAIMNENKFAVDSGYSMANVISGLSYATGLVTTTDATTTTIITQAIAASTVYHVDTIIVASSSQAKLASYRLQATVYGSGAAATILGDITSLHTVETDANWNATYATNAGNLLVQVSGATGTTIKWKAAMNYLGVA